MLAALPEGATSARALRGRRPDDRDGARAWRRQAGADPDRASSPRASSRRSRVVTASRLVAQAAGARRVVADGIAAKGWDVRVVEAYRTAALAPPFEALEAARSSRRDPLHVSVDRVLVRLRCGSRRRAAGGRVHRTGHRGGGDRPGRDRHRGPRGAHDPLDGRSAGRGAAPVGFERDVPHAPAPPAPAHARATPARRRDPAPRRRPRRAALRA